MPESTWGADPDDAAPPFGGFIHDGVYTGNTPGDDIDAVDSVDNDTRTGNSPGKPAAGSVPGTRETGRPGDIFAGDALDIVAPDDNLRSGGPLAESTMGPDEPEFATYSVGQASLRGGEIQLTATDSGLPMTLRVTADQLRRDPQDLGDDLVRLCRLAATRAGLARRSYLADLGIPAHALELLGLPTQAEMERMELADEAVHDYEPRSLMEADGSIW